MLYSILVPKGFFVSFPAIDLHGPFFVNMLSLLSAGSIDDLQKPVADMEISNMIRFGTVTFKLIWRCLVFDMCVATEPK